MISIEKHAIYLKGLKGAGHSLEAQTDHYFGALADEHEAHPEEAVVAGYVAELDRLAYALVNLEKLILDGIGAVAVQHGQKAAQEMRMTLSSVTAPELPDVSSEWTRTWDESIIERGRTLYEGIKGDKFFEEIKGGK